MNYRRNSKNLDDYGEEDMLFRLRILVLIFVFFVFIIVFRLLKLQVFEATEWKQKAAAQHFEGIYVPGKRGRIMVEDKDGTKYALATNITKYRIFLDPKFILEESQNPDEVVKNLAPAIIDIWQEREDNEKKKTPQQLRLQAEKWLSTYGGVPLGEVPLEYWYYPEEYQKNNINIDSSDLVDSFLSKGDFAEKSEAQKVNELVEYLRSLIYKFPKGRWVPVISRIDRQKADQIRSLNIKGIGIESMQERFYPENELASNLLGFIDRQGKGQFGLEQSLEEHMKGEDKWIDIDDLNVDMDTMNETGKDFVLTIDRSIQRKVEEVLQKHIPALRASAGQVVVMDTKDCSISAVGNYPSFDPNEFFNVYKTIPIMLNEDGIRWVKKRWEERNFKLKILSGGLVYENGYGPEVYKNRAVTDLYEPGSIIKPFAMLAAIDSNAVLPETVMMDTGKIVIDKFTIDNWDGKHWGQLTMTQVLEKSNNIGMVFVANKIGKRVLVDYYEKLGFATPIGLPVPGEPAPRLKTSAYLSDTDLATYSFGQGLAVTPMQVANAYCAIANGGVLTKPRILKDTEPKIIGRVMSLNTSKDILKMMSSVVERGGGYYAKMRYYSVAGKTGTAQISKEKSSGYETGVGATISSFAGILPADKPRYFILVKVDRPRATPWGSETAAPIFQDIASWLMNYEGVPPQRDTGKDYIPPPHIKED